MTGHIKFIHKYSWYNGNLAQPAMIKSIYTLLFPKYRQFVFVRDNFGELIKHMAKCSIDTFKHQLRTKKNDKYNKRYHLKIFKKQMKDVKKNVNNKKLHKKGY